MKLIFCIDNKNGMTFNGRRQSQDRELRKRILELTEGSRLLMSPYSAKQFEDSNAIISDAEFLGLAEKDDYCFIEDADFTLDGIDEVVLYNWNRDYPADRYFSFDLHSFGFRLASSAEFKGYSHEKITERIYIKEH